MTCVRYALCVLAAGACLGLMARSAVAEERSTTGGTRYRLFVPPGDPSTARPLALVFHADREGPEAAEALLAPQARERGWILVCPASKGRGYWTVPGEAAAALEVLDHVDRSFNVDYSRVYAAGFGSGGTLAYWLAIAHAERVKGAAALGGSLRWAESRGGLRHDPARRAQVLILSRGGRQDDPDAAAAFSRLATLGYAVERADVPAGNGPAPPPEAAALIFEWLSRRGAPRGPEEEENAPAKKDLLPPPMKKWTPSETEIEFAGAVSAAPGADAFSPAPDAGGPAPKNVEFLENHE